MLRVAKDGKKKYTRLSVSIHPQFWDFDKKTIIEYVFRTNLVRDESRVDELLKIVNEANLSNIKGFHHLCFIIRNSLTYEITMNEMSGISKVFEKICDGEASVLWTVTHENSLDCNLELVMIASK